MTKLTVIIATAIALLATILTPAHAQSHSQPYTLQSQTDWFVNDDPYLFGPQEAWYDGDSGHGYGNNNFVYTYGIGGEANADNWVHWYMGNRVGRQEIQVYVPSNQATATVNYNIYIGDTQSKVRVEQKNISGWHSLGRYNANGADVTIGVFDNDVEQHHARDGFTWSSIGIDAVAMRCVVNCSEGESGVLAPPRSVVAAPHGTNQIRVTWSAPANSGSSPISGYELEYSRPALRNHPLYGDRSPYNSGPVKVNESARSHTTGAFLRRVTYTVKVITISNDGQRSEPAITTATTAGSTPTSPTQPRNVKAAAHGTKKIRVTWSPPSDSGSASIKHYTVRFSRPAIGDDPAWSSTRTTTSTSRTSGNLRPGVTYTVVVTAINKAGKRGKSATTTGTVEGTDSSGPSAVRGLGTSPYDSDRFKVTWSAPSNDGGSPISTYEVRYSRPAVGSSPAWSKAWSAQGTSRTFEPAHKGVTYTVVVTAINKAGKRGKSATTTGTVEGTGPSTTKLSKDYPEVNDCWTRPHEWDGYQTGQCTSYVAWRLRENGVGESDLAYGSHYGFYNQWNAAPCAAVDRVGVPRWGNANQWDDCAKQIGMRVDKNPAPGSVLVKNDTGGGFGHVAYVEKVNRDGSIVISDGNFNSRCGIRTSQTVKKGTSPFGGDFWFIHFEEHAKRLAN